MHVHCCPIITIIHPKLFHLPKLKITPPHMGAPEVTHFVSPHLGSSDTMLPPRQSHQGEALLAQL